MAEYKLGDEYDDGKVKGIIVGLLKDGSIEIDTGTANVIVKKRAKGKEEEE